MSRRLLAAVIPLCLAAACVRGPADGPLRASGTIEARQVRLSAKIAGDLLALPVKEGDRVKPGDPIASIDHAGLDIQLRQAEAGAVLAQAQLDLLKSGARAEDIRQVEEAFRQAESVLKTAEEDDRRMRDLAAKGSVTAKQAEDAASRLIVTRAQTSAAAEALKKSRTLARPEELRAARARLDQAQAASDLLRKAIADCDLVSPVSGVVTQVPVERGELIAAGATVAVVSELDRVHVMIYVTEVELARVKLGGRADISIDGAPGRKIPGTITYISPEAEFTPKNVQTREDRVKLVFGVKIEIDNRDGLLKPGLPADAVLTDQGR
ncbi:MAG: efflux RND transporter periplasmic adaptor subunit [Candidatus Aminicenantes bacterium]|nr:efflux RND transporter periplasmic adaptor subunit [Candidatus Aminicenantes bacterium]